MGTLRIIIATGGTGGHIYPAISVAKTAIKRGHLVKLIIGDLKGIKPEELKEFRSYRIISGPFVGMNIFEIFLSSLKLVTGILENLALFIKFGEFDTIIATGSYATLPVLLVSRLFGKKFWLLEQNVIPGETVKRFERYAEGVFVSYSKTSKWLRNQKIFAVGNPIRFTEKEGEIPGYLKIFKNKGIPIILVLGGSQGSLKLAEIGAKVARSLKNYYFCIQAGRFYGELINRFGERGDNYRIIKYIYNMSDYLRAADIVISRAGGSTITELQFFGKPSILVPFKGAKGHQSENAKIMEEAGASIVIEEEKLSVSELARILEGLLNKKEKLQEMGKRAFGILKKDAALRIIEILEKEYAK